MDELEVSERAVWLLCKAAEGLARWKPGVV